MPVDDALKFINHVGHSPELRKRVEALKGVHAIRDMAVLAGQEGFRFTEEEYRAAVMVLAEGELSEESLNEVLRELGVEPQ